MANDFIPIDQTSAQGALLKQYVQMLRSAFEAGARVQGIMTHNNDGVDFSPIEKVFGVPAGTGQTVFDLVNGSTGAMNGQFQNFDCKTITEKVG